MLGRRTSVTDCGLWPTPVASDTGGRNTKYAQGGTPLSLAVRTWPTPTVHGNHNRKGVSAKSGDGLATAVKMYPTATATATATMHKGWSPGHKRADTNDRLDYLIEREAFSHGQQTQQMRLNPLWVEWLMGWPLGHTDLQPLGMDKYLEWRRQHGFY